MKKPESMKVHFAAVLAQFPCGEICPQVVTAVMQINLTAGCPF